jgi:hypothetical protein
MISHVVVYFYGWDSRASWASGVYGVSIVSGASRASGFSGVSRASRSSGVAGVSRASRNYVTSRVRGDR